MTACHRTTRPTRPFVTLNLAVSIDGKLTPIDGGKVNFGSRDDRAQMEALRADADAVLFGGGTLRSEDPPLIIRDQEIRERRFAAKGSHHPRNITVCSVLPATIAEMEFFRSPETEKLVFTTERTPPAVREVARRYAHVEVVVPTVSGRVDLIEVLRRLSLLGVRNLLLEGGGELNFSFLEADLIDEIYLTICPFVFGGRTAVTAFDGAGFPRAGVRKFALKSHRISGSGEVFLHYDVLPDPPAISVSPYFANGFEIR